MAQIKFQLTDGMDCADCSQNPEILLMIAEQELADCDILESYWLAGLAVTKPQSTE